MVIKTPSVNFEDDAAYIEQFTREEWIGRRLDSPHVLKVIPPKQRRQFLYSVTEYVEGQTLRQWMDDHPQQDLPMTRGIVEQIAIGLRAFHRDEMIHQDLKPENIVITGTGFMKCMPMNLPGRPLAAASRVIEIDDVLVARMVSGPRLGVSFS